MKILVLLFGFFVFQSANADVHPLMVTPNDEVGQQDSEAVVNEVSADSPEIIKLRINNELWYILLLSSLCIASLIIVLTFIRMNSGPCTSRDIVNASGLILIIFGTIILVLVVNTSEQLTAAIGILGAIAGYLFRSVQGGGSAESNEEVKD
ncbi:hypothetical protein MNBD_GAMMA09-1461 [hydrothermal vent metagenome]|uniref:Uncharacterized protein n=1 Tax=hydrothermal vent metagenome TaxID=652676 RepID=A0A3B0XSG6_9ZZZZ